MKQRQLLDKELILKFNLAAQPPKTDFLMN